MRLPPRGRVSRQPARSGSPSFMPAQTSFKARRLQALLHDVANLSRRLAYKDGHVPPNLSWRIAPVIEQPFVFTTTFHARRCCTVLDGAGGRRCDEYVRTLREPFLVGHSGGLKLVFGGLPARHPADPPGSGMGCVYPCEGTPDRGSPPLSALPCAVMDRRR